jgi:D-alanyl-D-alanine carboxypeptidase
MNALRGRRLWMKITLLAAMLLLGAGLRTVDIAQAQDFGATLDAIVAEYADADGPAVVVQLTTPEGTWTTARGLADGARPAAPSDRFRIGSMSKTYVAVAALMLVQDGVFNLDDPASNWLPAEVVANIANADSVTIRQLLAMRAGIDDYLGQQAFWDTVEADPTRAWTAEEALTFAYGLPPVAAPDATYFYSNTNYLLLQLVLEAASGQALGDLIRARILDPLRLNETYTQISESLPGGFVSGYSDFDGDGVAEDVSGINDGAGLGDGGLVATADDVTRFYQALLVDQGLLSDALLEELLYFSPADDGNGYSLGLNAWETALGTAWGHSGGVLGFLSFGAYLPDAQMTVVVLSASEDFAPEDLATDVVEAYFGRG